MKRNDVVAQISAPSMGARAIAAVMFLIGFYLLIVGVALTLMALPVAIMWAAPNVTIAHFYMLAFCWVPALMLLMSVAELRAPPFVAEGRRLTDAEAPELFALVQELAARVGTEAPSEVYLVDRVNLAVCEPRVYIGARRRVLFVGAPLLAVATVDELRAGLAHELGHYAFGDTRLVHLVASVHAAFRAVLESTRRPQFADTGIRAIEAGREIAAALGRGLVRTYARLYWWVTRRGERRAELAADELARASSAPRR